MVYAVVSENKYNNEAIQRPMHSAVSDNTLTICPQPLNLNYCSYLASDCGGNFRVVSFKLIRRKHTKILQNGKAIPDEIHRYVDEIVEHMHLIYSYFSNNTKQAVGAERNSVAFTCASRGLFIRWI
jgi:hexokinase